MTNFHCIRALAIWVVCGGFLARIESAEALPRNLGGGLDKLVAWYFAHAPQTPEAQRRALLDAEQPAAKHAQVDFAVNSATVDVRLDGTRTVAQVRATLEALGCTVLGTHDIGRAGSIISVKLPLSRALDAARAPGVFSLVLVQKPSPRVGAVTSQGVAVMKAENLQLNGTTLTGNGLSVGVISDSYNRTSPDAQADVASGDLPGTGNPQGHTQPVVVLEDGEEGDTDEGRAMLQIVHDVAPDAKLAFATAGATQTTLAEAIRSLRTTALADVIVDDITFHDEPFFSDGPVAQAVDDVVNSATLPGKRVAYYSAAGNEGVFGYSDTFRPISDAEVRAKHPKHNLQLKSVPAELTSGGFHNFGTAEEPLIVQKVKVTGDSATLDFQWDDPFVPPPGESTWITTDYNLLVFSSTGAYLGDLSGIDDNFSTGEPVELAELPLKSRGKPRAFQIAITRRSGGTPQADRLRYVVLTDGRFESVPFQRLAPTIYGHCGARSSDAVAAYHYDNLSRPADFTSAGPLTIYFDRDGRRLAEPEVRFQPTIAAPDNVDTTFFPQGPHADVDNNGFPNFDGTSAAAPHAAGVAALLLQASGGPGSLTAAQLRSALQNSVSSHELDPAYSKAVITAAGSTATLEARGDESNDSAFDPRFFKLSLGGAATARITQIVIDLAPAGLVFDPSAKLGLPFRVGAFSGISKRDFAALVSRSPRTTLTVKLKNMSFGPGATLEFGIDRDVAATKNQGNSADLLAGVTVTVTTVDNGVTTQNTGTFQNQLGKGFSPIDGFGLIDAQAALSLLP